jgi:UDP-N-acetylglucosamine:LPS N-acetylglucosamine transferase
MKLCLVASSGGHLMELLFLREAWEGHERFWVTYPTGDAKSLLEEERTVWAYHPTNRNIPNLFRNARLAWRLLRRERPDAIVSTGAGVAVPFIWAGCLLKIPTIFIESLTFTVRPSLSGRLVYPCAQQYYVQWPDLARKYPKAIYRGAIL